MAKQATKPSTPRPSKGAPEKAEETGDAAAKAPAVVKKKVVKKVVRKKAVKKSAASQRLRLVWGVFDNSNQQVSVFPYPQREEADKKAAALSEKGRGHYFVQPVKEPIPEPVEVEAEG